MAEPKQKSLELPNFLRRHLPNFVTPMWIEGERWRNVVRNEPTAIICRDRLIVYAQALPWDIRPREIKDEKKLEKDIAYYKNYVLRDFDILLDLLWQDALDLPVGGNVELVRWPSNVIPTVEHDGIKFSVTQPNPRGHIFKVVPLDGATVSPTHDPEFPLMQRLPGDMNNAVYFSSNEVSRIVLTPRPEIKVRGYGMPPPQRIFLSLSLAYYGHQYYAKLLMDTPEAGILDLMDLSEEDARDWVSSYGTLLQGIDPLKIGVLYKHTIPAKWIPFGRPPSEMMYDEITERNNRIIAAGYWLTLADVGLDPSGKTLAGEIRRQRETRLTGFGMIREKTTNFMNRNILPHYLEFAWIERDDEALSNTGRARLLNAQALKTMTEAGLITAADGQAQLKKDGLLTVELSPVEEAKEEKQALPPAPGTKPALPGQSEDATAEERDRVPPSQGGQGDVGQTQRAVLGDPNISAVEPGSSNFDRLGLVFKNGFDDILKRMGDIQLRRLVRASLKSEFDLTVKAIINLSAEERPKWVTERMKSWFDEESIFDEMPQIKKANQATLAELEQLLNNDRWWELTEEEIAKIADVLGLAFSEGATVAAELIQQFLYESGVVNSPDLIGLNFDLKNPATLAELDASAAQMVRHVNDGTKFYLKRIIAASVDEGVSSQEIALRIQEKQSLKQILDESNLIEKVTNRTREEVERLTPSRIESIVNTEINRAESEGRLKQWSEQGLTKKRFAHTGTDIPCKFCQAAIDEGEVGIDFGYLNVFGERVQSPPLHPTVDHCHVEFSEEELIAKAGELNVWTGE